MVYIIKTINGVKTAVPVTADTGAGNPLGTIIAQYKKSAPAGYLYLDGSTFDAAAYPALYAYLGTNVLPDYRECALVGAEQNSTETIATHDVYTEGQFKDDRIQNITGNFNIKASMDGTAPTGAFTKSNGNSNYSLDATSTTKAEARINFNANNVVRAGTTTRGKRKAVFFYIKAISGVAENTQETLVNTLNAERSYSTEEINTGAKWIDGKAIYKRTFIADTSTGSGQNYLPDAWRTLSENFPVASMQGNVETVVKSEFNPRANYSMPVSVVCSSGVLQMDVMRGTSIKANESYLTLYYTKTA